MDGGYILSPMTVQSTYKRLLPSQASPFAAFLLLLSILIAPKWAHSDSSLYVVEGVKVDVTDDNALAARDKAFTIAQQQAYKILVDRLTQNNGFAEEPDPDPITLASMIRDYEITKEKLSSVRYVGTYTVRFKEDEIKQYFNQTSQSYTDVQSPPILIIPFIKTDAGYQLWAGGNDWKQAWEGRSNVKGLVPLEMLLGDLKDMQAIQDGPSLQYDVNALRAITQDYGASEAVIAVAVPDGGLSSVQGSNDPARGALRVELYKTSAPNPVMASQLFVAAQTGMSREDLYNKGAESVHAKLSKNWKNQTIASPVRNQRVLAVVPIKGLPDWMRVKKILDKNADVSDLVVQSLSPGQATISMVLKRGVPSFNRMLGGYGLLLETSGAHYVLKEKPSAPLPAESSVQGASSLGQMPMASKADIASWGAPAKMQKQAVQKASYYQQTF